MSLKQRVPFLRWSVWRLAIGVRNITRTGQIGDGREAAAVDYVLKNAKAGAVDDVLATIDRFAYEKSMLVNVGDENEWMIQNRGLDYAGADPVMLDLLRWHGAEEIEHRCLVFDVYQNLCGNYPMRALSMLFAAPQFVFWWLAGARYLMANDPTIDATPRWRDWLRAAPQYRVPGPWKLLVTVPGRYLRPSHHPSMEASTQMALDYLEHSPAARAARESAEANQRSKETKKQPDAAENETEKAEG